MCVCVDVCVSRPMRLEHHRELPGRCCVTPVDQGWADLGKHSIDRGEADEAKGSGDDAQHRQVVVVRRRLLEVELRYLPRPDDGLGRGAEGESRHFYKFRLTD